jgi:hypothetical protein
VVDVDQARDLPDRGSVTLRLTDMDDLWDVILAQEASWERFRSLSVSVPLKKDVKHEVVLVHRSPEPVSDAIGTRANLVHMPPGIPTGFPMAQFFCKEGSEFKAPLAEGFVAHLKAAPVQQFLHVPVLARRPHGRCSGKDAQRKAVVERSGRAG